MPDSTITRVVTVAGEQTEPLAPSDAVELACGTEGCSANCCAAGPPIVLNPYEISRIRAESGMPYEDLLDVFETGRAKGFPLVMLPRTPACFFLTAQGCRIYNARPLACRLFPLGRVYHQSRSHIVLPGNNRCDGLVSSPSRTVTEYLADQETGRFIEMADQWIDFVSEMEQLDLPDTPVTSVAFHMLVYSPDTPSAADQSRHPENPEADFLLRLATARIQVPRFLKRA